MLWICDVCTARYSVGAARCPQCGSTDYTEEGAMPKITAHGGPSDENVPDPGFETVDFESATVTGDGTGEPGPDAQGPAVIDGVDADTARQLYEQDTVDNLRTELKDRGLVTSGNKAELVERLLADDAEQADSGD